MDQLLLLTIQYECSKQGIVLPWGAIANRFAAEKGPTGKCMVQHLSKLRLEMLNRGAWVPPLAGRSKASMNDKVDVRGVIRIGTTEDNQPVYRDIEWDEDTSKLVNPTDLDQRYNGITIDKNIVPASTKLTRGSAKRSVGRENGQPTKPDKRHKNYEQKIQEYEKNKRANEIDPAELASDDDYSPGGVVRPKKRANRGRMTKKTFKYSEDEDEDDGADMNDIDSVKSEGDIEIPMMLFNDSEKRSSIVKEQSRKVTKIITLRPGKEKLRKFMATRNESSSLVNGSCDDRETGNATELDMYGKIDIDYENGMLLDTSKQDFPINGSSDQMMSFPDPDEDQFKDDSAPEIPFMPTEAEIQQASLTLNSMPEAVLHAVKMNLIGIQGYDLEIWNDYFTTNPCESLNEVERQLRERIVNMNGARFPHVPSIGNVNSSGGDFSGSPFGPVSDFGEFDISEMGRFTGSDVFGQSFGSSQGGNNGIFTSASVSGAELNKVNLPS
jgi:hypothetical protein